MLTCDLCGADIKNLSGLNAHFRAEHKDEYNNVGWPGIKSRIIGKQEAKQEAERKVEVKKREDYEEVVEEKKPIPMETEVAFDEDVREISPTKLTHRLKLDPRLNVLYAFLKSKDAIPNNWTIGDFINNYVLGHVKMKDGLDLSVLQRISGGEDMKIAMLEPKGSDEGKDKKIDPDEELKDIDRMMARQLKMKTYDRMLGKGKSSDDEGGGLNRVLESAMAFKVINQVFGGEESNKPTKEVEKLKEQLAKLEDDKKIEVLKSAIESLKETVKTQKPSGEVTSKDLITLMSQSNKQQGDFKDIIHSKDMELFRQSNESTTKMIAEKLDNLANRPRPIDQIKEISETAKALEGSGFWKKGTDKSSTEVISDLIGNVTNTVTNSQGFQNWMSNISKQEQEQQYTPQQLAQIQALERQQQSQQQGQTQPQPETTPKPLDPDIEAIARNVVQVSDQEDKRKRLAEERSG